MKTLCKILVPCFVILLTNNYLLAESLSSICAQKEMLVSKTTTTLDNVAIDVQIEFPEFRMIPPIVFLEEGPIDYTKEGNTIYVKSSEIPFLKTEIKEIPEKFKPLSLSLEMVEPSVSINIDDLDEIEISRTDLKIKLYKAGSNQITGTTRPELDLILRDVKFEVVNHDKENRIAEVEFSSRFPKTGHDMLDDFLYGKKLEGSIVVEY